MARSSKAAKMGRYPPVPHVDTHPLSRHARERRDGRGLHGRRGSLRVVAPERGQARRGRHARGGANAPKRRRRRRRRRRRVPILLDARRPGRLLPALAPPPHQQEREPLQRLRARGGRVRPRQRRPRDGSLHDPPRHPPPRRLRAWRDSARSSTRSPPAKTSHRSSTPFARWQCPSRRFRTALRRRWPCTTTAWREHTAVRNLGGDSCARRRHSRARVEP